MISVVLGDKRMEKNKVPRPDMNLELQILNASYTWLQLQKEWSKSESKSAAPSALHYLTNLWCIVQQFHGIKVVLVFDEIISQAAVGEVLHYQPEVPSSCRNKAVKCDT